jgi:hypothetical protein
MRADMAKVIVERPRHRGWAWTKPKGYGRKLRRDEEFGAPRREGMKARWQWHTKSFNEHLGPLRRYLDDQVGRPWDKVFSEICERINRNSVVQDHVRDHVEQYVVRHVILIDGVPCAGTSGSGCPYGEPLRRLRWSQWYVCPRTGLLRRIPEARRRPKQPTGKQPPRYIPVGDELQCRLIDGAWHLVTLKRLPNPLYEWGRCRNTDVLLQVQAAKLTPEDARWHYGAEVYAVAARRLGKREQRQYPIPIELWT